MIGWNTVEHRCYASLSVVRLGQGNVDATVNDSATIFGH
jgi:hypothetical protein